VCHHATATTATSATATTRMSLRCMVATLPAAHATCPSRGVANPSRVAHV
jgi:hypothetical protein